MAYIKYTGLKTPTDVLTKMVEYIKSRGYTVVQDITDDLNIYDMSSVDGKRFCFKDRTGEYFIILRTANNVDIFGSTNDSEMDTKDIKDYTNDMFYGIGMVVSEGYSKSQRWYNQYRVPVNLKGSTVQCTWLPVPISVVDPNAKVDAGGSPVMMAPEYTLYCNNITEPSDTLIFSLVKENTTYLYNLYQCAHMIVGNVNKYDDWTGGIYFSASANHTMIKTAGKCFEDTYGADYNIYPVLCSGKLSTTFLRIDVDDATSKIRGDIRWASSGEDNVTGKKLSLPIRLKYGVGNGYIPNYGYIQSSNSLDWGRNVNTLNCISINMPIYFSVLVDPDVLDNYAACGTATGVYFIDMLNMQTASTYEQEYPTSGNLCQVFSMGMRRGTYGYDGISIRQRKDEDDNTSTSTTSA